MSDSAGLGPFLIGGLVGLVVIIVLTCVCYCCYTKRRGKKRKKPPANRKRRPPNVISHLHGWVWISAVVNIWCTLEPLLSVVRQNVRKWPIGEALTSQTRRTATFFAKMVVSGSRQWPECLSARENILSSISGNFAVSGVQVLKMHQHICFLKAAYSMDGSRNVVSSSLSAPVTLSRAGMKTRQVHSTSEGSQ